MMCIYCNTELQINRATTHITCPKCGSGFRIGYDEDLDGNMSPILEEPVHIEQPDENSIGN